VAWQVHRPSHFMQFTAMDEGDGAKAEADTEDFFT
jgi:hypothetical protein